MTESPNTSGRPSKTQLKREMAELQVLGQKLLSLKPHQLKALALPEALVDAVELGQRLNKQEAIRRHTQYIGRVMRDLDEETVARIKQYLGALKR
jgi:ribosome-associated protein